MSLAPLPCSNHFSFKVSLEPLSLSLSDLSLSSSARRAPLVVAVGEAAGQLLRGGGPAVPGRPRRGAVRGRRAQALPELLRGGELREPEGGALRRPHRLLRPRHQVRIGIGIGSNVNQEIDLLWRGCGRALCRLHDRMNLMWTSKG